MGIRKYKPTTPGRRGSSVADFVEITRSRPEKSLVRPLSKSGGRNNHGRVTTRHKGGGHKRAYRVIDFRRHDKDGVPAKVAHIEYDPNRTARIALLHYLDGEKRYIIAPNKLGQGDRVESGPNADIKPGNNLQLRHIPTGTVVHAVEEGLVQGVDGGVEVARDGEVNEHLQGVAPPFERVFDVFARDEHVVAARRADDDVGFVQLCGQLFEADGEAAVRFGQGLGMREGAVGDDEALDVGVFQVFGDELRGFASADDECGAAVVVVKEAVGEFDAGGGDGDVVGADLRAVADLFGDGKALLEEAL